MNNEKSFVGNPIVSSRDLEDIIKMNIENGETSYYLFTNSWDKLATYITDRIYSNPGVCSDIPVNVIDVFDIPNGLQIMKSVIQEYRETISVAPIWNYTKVPMLVVLHKAFPRVVDYSGSIFAELGL